MKKATISTIVSVGVGALAGAVLALGSGLIAMALLPNEGFADLGVAAFMTIIGIPVGAVVGSVGGWWVAHRRRLNRSVSITGGETARN